MTRSTLTIIILVVATSLIFVYGQNFFSDLSKIEDITTQIQYLKKEFLAPPPLRASKENPDSFLTRGGTFTWTNTQRKNNGLGPLLENSKLNIAASLRAKDMFENQYFAHESPTGKDATHLTVGQGYDYIMIGENIALGNFKDDQELVQAWMDSPGHRANILNTRYTELGVAVLRGTFEGRTTWIAVQVFGRPVSDCPAVDSSLKFSIDSNEGRINQLKPVMDNLRSEIENMKPRRGPEYNQKVEEYNKLVDEYNALVLETKNLVGQYNGQVRVSNQCVNES